MTQLGPGLVSSRLISLEDGQRSTGMMQAVYFSAYDWIGRQRQHYNHDYCYRTSGHTFHGSSQRRDAPGPW